MLAWSVEMDPYFLEYKPRMSMKDQVLAYFIAEFSFNEEENSKELNQEEGRNERRMKEADEDNHTYL